MRLRNFLLLLTTFAMSACASSTSNPMAASSATVTSLTIGGASSLAVPGQTNQLTATASFADGRTQDVTSSATWQSSNTVVGTVTGGGLVTAITPGGMTVTVTYQGKTATANFMLVFSFSPNNSLTATIDGTPFAGTFVSVIRSSGRISIGGSNFSSSQGVTLFVAMPEAAGTYTLPASFALLSTFIPGVPPPGPGSAIPPVSLWATTPTTGGGTITLSALTSNSASGTFSLNLGPLPGSSATGTKAVTNGSFNVTF
jgi:hypothetical protein